MGMDWVQDLDRYTPALYGLHGKRWQLQKHKRKMPLHHITNYLFFGIIPRSIAILVNNLMRALASAERWRSSLVQPFPW